MPLRIFANAIAAVAVIGAAAAGAASPALAADLPAADQVVGLLSGIADPYVPAAGKSDLVEGGLSPIERSVMDGRMKKGLANGKLPLTISAANIQPAGPDAATADVTGSSAELDPHSVNLRLVDRGGWKLAHSSLMMLSQMSSN